MQSVIQESENKSPTLVESVLKPGSWLTKIDFINHLVLFNNAMIVVMAEQGGGKTTFINLLQAGLEYSIKSHVVNIVSPFDQTGLLTQLAAVFHLRVDAELTVANLIRQINERKSHVLVILDNAQYLPDTFLKEVLIELNQQESPCFFHLCPVSDFSLMVSLNQLETNLFDKLVHIIEPGALTESELNTYLLSALPSSSHTEQLMSDKRKEQFYQLTGGNMARINARMTDFFSTESLHPPLRERVSSRYAGIAATFLVALLASGYIWKNQDLFRSDKSSIGKVQEAVVSKPLPSVIPGMPSTKQKILASYIPAYDSGEKVSFIPAFHIAAARQVVQPLPLKREFKVALDDEVNNDTSLVIMDKVVVIPKTITTDSLKETAILEREAIASRELPQQIIQPVIGIRNHVPVKERYTIQLVASPRLVDVKRFIKKHHLKNNFKIWALKRQGADWYVLTFGDYGQMQYAKRKLRHLPASFARFKPWIRSTSELGSVG